MGGQSIQPTPDEPPDLIALNTLDMLAALGVVPTSRAGRVLRWLCRPLARRFARQVTDFDQQVEQAGLAAAADWLLRQHARQVLVAGQTLVPRSGPLLIVANHPGVADTAALFLSIPRPDLHILAADRPFLRALPATSRRLIYLSERPGDRLTVLRSMTRHLRTGRAILTFPGGEIEPDPACLPGASERLNDWSSSIGLLVRLAPDLQVVPAIVSGVLSTAAQRHPLTRLRRTRADRERLAAMLQIVVPAYRSVTIRVSFGPPLAAQSLQAAGDDAAIASQIVAAARRAMLSPATDWHPLINR